MSSYRSVLRGAVWAVLAVFLVSASVSPLVAQANDEGQARVEVLLDSLAVSGSFSGSVGIALDGVTVFEHGYGLANQEWDIPNTVDTKFDIASITKQFTAMAIVMLQERGLLSVHDPICQYLDDCPDAWAGITIEHLLTHTSGITAECCDDNRIDTTPADIVAYLQQQPVSFEPGSNFSYATSTYALLGTIISRVSEHHYSYRKFLEDNIIQPLGLTNTGVDAYEMVIGQRAEGYDYPGRRAGYIDLTNLFAGGSMYSTVGDLLRWNQALYSGEVVSQSSLDAMLDAAVDIPPALASEAGQMSGNARFHDRYAYGMFYAPLAGHPALFAPGSVPGFSTCLAHLIDINMDVVVLGNAEDHDQCGLIELIISDYLEGV